jgi:hypothetical protein
MVLSGQCENWLQIFVNIMQSSGYGIVARATCIDAIIWNASSWDRTGRCIAFACIMTNQWKAAINAVAFAKRLYPVIGIECMLLRELRHALSRG